MWLGQGMAVFGVLLVLALSAGGFHTPLAFALPMILLGVGHGLVVPSALTRTVGLIPALAGSAAAIAGLAQQLMGAVGGFAVGLVDNHDATAVSLLMLGITQVSVASQWLLHRRSS